MASGAPGLGSAATHRRRAGRIRARLSRRSARSHCDVFYDLFDVPTVQAFWKSISSAAVEADLYIVVGAQELSQVRMLFNASGQQDSLDSLRTSDAYLPEEGAACGAPPDIVDSGENDVDCSLQVFSKQGDSITKGHRSDGTLRSCSIIQQDVLPTTEGAASSAPSSTQELFCRQRKVLPTTGNRNEGTEIGNCSFLQLKDIRALVVCSYKHYAVALPWNFVMVRQKVDTVGLSMLLRMVLFLQTRGRQVGSIELQDVFCAGMACSQTKYGSK